MATVAQTRVEITSDIRNPACLVPRSWKSGAATEGPQNPDDPSNPKDPADAKKNPIRPVSWIPGLKL